MGICRKKKSDGVGKILISEEMLLDSISEAQKEMDESLKSYQHKNVANPIEGTGTVGFESIGGGSLSVTGRKTSGNNGIEIDGGSLPVSGASTTIELNTQYSNNIIIDVLKNVDKEVLVRILDSSGVVLQNTKIEPVGTFITVEALIPLGTDKIIVEFVFNELANNGQEIVVDNIQIKQNL